MVNDRILAMCELSEDLFFHKVPAGRYAYYVDSSLEAGKSLARKFAGQEIHKLYSEHGIEIEYKKSSGAAFGVLLRGQAEMDETSCVVRLYRDSLDALVEHSAWGSFSPMDAGQAERIHLAHEFFHFWEHRSRTPVSEQLECVETARLLGIRRWARVCKSSEIAAHAFAKSLLELPVLPNYYDYLYLMGMGKLTKASFEEKCNRLAVLLEGANQCA